jgi:Protein of unknown function (DUF2934)
MVETETLALTEPTAPAISERARGDLYFTPPVDICETDEEWPTMTSRAVTTLPAALPEGSANLQSPDSVKVTVENKVTLSSAKPSPNGQLLSEDAIRLRANFKWKVAGEPSGDGVVFWLEAERELGTDQDGDFD